MRRTHVGSLAITSFLVIVLGVLGIGTATAAPIPAPSTGSGESVLGKLLVMLDASGSMLEAEEPPVGYGASGSGRSVVIRNTTKLTPMRVGIAQSARRSAYRNTGKLSHEGGAPGPEKRPPRDSSAESAHYRRRTTLTMVATSSAGSTGLGTCDS